MSVSGAILDWLIQYYKQINYERQFDCCDKLNYNTKGSWNNQIF